MTPYVLSRSEIDYLIDLLAADPYKVRVAWDDGLKIKANEGTWSLPLGTSEAEYDTTSSASRQHYIDTGRYLRVGESE